MFSPITGKPAKYLKPANYDDIMRALNKSKFANLLHSCGSCGCSFMSSSDEVTSLSCIGCGECSEYGNALMRGRKARKNRL